MIREAIKEKYHQVAFDTEFKLASDKKHMVNVHPCFASCDERYCGIKASTDKGSIRQLGLTLSADDGSVLVWEFNFGQFHFPAEMEEGSSTMWQTDCINSYFFSDFLWSSCLIWPIEQHDDDMDYIPWHIWCRLFCQIGHLLEPFARYTSWVWTHCEELPGC